MVACTVFRPTASDDRRYRGGRACSEPTTGDVLPGTPAVLTITTTQLQVVSEADNTRPVIQPCGNTWIAIRLIDEDDNPVPRERYRLQLPDMSELEGTLDDNGRAYVDNLDPGICQVCFPDI